MPEEEKKKAITGEAQKDVQEFHKARFDEMIVRAKSAGLEPPTPEPEKKRSDREKGQ